MKKVNCIYEYSFCGTVYYYRVLKVVKSIAHPFITTCTARIIATHHLVDKHNLFLQPATTLTFRVGSYIDTKSKFIPKLKATLLGLL